jgi:hypothetical protein
MSNIPKTTYNRKYLMSSNEMEVCKCDEYICNKCEEDLETYYFESIARACEALGWQISFPKVKDDVDIPGMIIGTPDYVNNVLDAVQSVYGDEEYDNWENVNKKG